MDRRVFPHVFVLRIDVTLRDYKIKVIEGETYE